MKPASPNPAPEPTAAEEVDVLFPDVDVTVRDPDTGETVTLTVREFRFLEGLRVGATARPLVEAFAQGVSADADIDGQAVATALSDHADAWLDCIAQATGRGADWLARLSDADGNALSVAMWSANGDFFGRRLVEALGRRRKEAGPSPSPKSSTPSSGPGTAADTATSPSA